MEAELRGWPPALPIDDPGTAGFLLAAFGLVFVARVVGQLLVVLRAPSWLPPMTEWQSGILPYRWLLSIQLVSVAVMAFIVGGLLGQALALLERRPDLGAVLVAIGWVYALAMVVRYGVRMARHPEARWTGQTIPIAVHLVLALWILVLGSYLRGP